MALIVLIEVKLDVNRNLETLVKRGCQGGHAVTITGWSYINNKFHWRLLNSWGNDWGDNGYAWLPEDYPWIENAYAIVDTSTKMKFDDYIMKYY